MPFPLAIPIAATIAGAAANLWGGERRNRMQQIEAAKTRAHQTAEAGRSMAFQGAQAQKSMAFSERMRNTSWQAGLSDMQAAGINPALAYSMGGASSPMGAAGSGATGGGAMAQIEDTLSPAISSAKHSMRLRQELKNMKENALLMESQGHAAKASARRDQTAGFVNVATEGRINQETVGQAIRNQLQMLAIPTARNIARYEQGAVGRNIRPVSAITGALGPVAAFGAGSMANVLARNIGKARNLSMWNMTSRRRR